VSGAVGNFISGRSKPMTFWTFDKGHRKEVLFHPFLIFFSAMEAGRQTTSQKHLAPNQRVPGAGGKFVPGWSKPHRHQ